jgi:beta-lactam-binding protein with PASTA domain
VTVPSLRGDDEAAARSRLNGVGLVLGEVAQRPSNQPIGSVVDQSPAAGTVVKRGSPVQAWLAVPLPPVVPDLRGQDRASATDALTTARLRLGEVGERPSDRPPGTIVDQMPLAGTTAPAGAAVNVWLAVPIAIEVPDLAGRTRSEAERMIARSGLAVGATKEEPSPNTPGTVLRQLPVAGTRVTPGTGVDIVLAVAPVVVTIFVPDVVGRSQMDADRILQTAGLRIGRITQVRAIARSRTVTRQFPEARTTVSPGGAVDLEIGAIDLALLWMLAAGVGLGLGAAGVVASVRRARGRRWSSITLAPHMDVGVQTTFPDEHALASSELSLHDFPDRGFQTLQGPSRLVLDVSWGMR